jgi:DNA-binding NarL/FixJ family response regulator
MRLFAPAAQFLSEHVDLRVEGEAANGREAIDLVRNTKSTCC